MKNIIVYFSQTGNTETVAVRIQNGIKSVAGHCELVKIKDANPLRLFEYDLIGLGSPVFGRVPHNVLQFVENMKYVAGKHVFAFCTHGSMPEFFFPELVPALQKRGLVVIGTHGWYGNVTLYHLCDPYPTAGHPDEIDLEEAVVFGKEMAERSRRITAGEKELLPPVIQPLPSAPLMPPPPDTGKPPDMSGFLAEKSYHPEKCRYPKCRLCQEHCPVNGIDLSVKPPVIAQPCINCEFCARICPTGAIDITEWLDTFSREIQGMMLEQMVLPHLAAAEAAGTFRRLIPLEKITNIPNYQLHKKHPQWIIGKGIQ